MEKREPVTLPTDAVIIPYRAADGEQGVQSAEKVLVPYDTYVELWNRAYPDQRIDTKPLVTKYSLAGAEYQTALEGDEHLLVTGEMKIVQFTDDEVTIPLPLAGGVLARAVLDGKPARLSVVEVAGAAEQQQSEQIQRAAVEPPNTLLALRTSGKGRKSLEIALRLRLDRRGGWRIVNGLVPAAVATSLGVRVPEAQTEVRLGKVDDRRSYETETADEVIDTSLRRDGQFLIQWRPQVAAAEVDRSLTTESQAVLDIQEDGLRLAWKLDLRFPRSRRSSFELRVPDEYLIERVVGQNVRQWDSESDNGHQRVVVSLLKEVVDRESFTVVLSRRGAVGQGDLAEFDAPLVNVPDAVLQRGLLLVRRSVLLDVRTTRVAGLTRTDGSDRVINSVVDEAGYEESPLEIRPFQAFQFSATSFELQLAATPIAARIATEVQTVLRIVEQEVGIESRIKVNIQDRPLYRLRLAVPDTLEITEVTAPGSFEWAVSRTEAGQVLSIYLATGREDELSVIVHGRLDRSSVQEDVNLPRLEVLDVPSQRGALAVVVDPAFRASAVDLENCEVVLREHVDSWLNTAQRELAQLAVAYRSTDYRGTIRVAAKQPRVRAITVTNVKVTQRTIEETILLDFNVTNAGVRELRFLLPEHLREAVVLVPLLRQKTITTPENGPDGYVRVELELQDAVSGQIQVFVKHDRLLSIEDHTAPIPMVETGETQTRFVVLESAGRDEVIVDDTQELEPLSRLQSQRRILAGILGSGITRAFAVGRDATEPKLSFHIQQRTTVQTVGARIGRAETVLVMDGSGAYRAQVEYRVNNDTEQFLEIELPEDADLWTAVVADDPVKPTLVPGTSNTRRVRIPIIKTAEGDLDYGVVLKYGGRISLARLKSVEFPLVKTAKIKVELSQVTLRLPETHRWMTFGGSMTRVTDEGDYRAGHLIHLTKQIQMIDQGLRSSNPFTRFRCATNLGQLGIAVQNYHGSYRNIPSAKLEKAMLANGFMLKQAQAQLKRNQDDTEEVNYNRGRLFSQFEQQKNDVAANELDRLSVNFDAPTQAEKPGGGKERSKREDQRFNKRWLAENKLGNESVMTKGRRSRYNANRSKKSERGGWGRAQGGMDDLMSEDAMKKLASLGYVSNGESDWEADESRDQAAEESELERYALQFKAPQGQTRNGEPPSRKPISSPEIQEHSRSLVIQQAGEPVRGRDSRATGHLASLDVNLPHDQAGTVYFFTSPRSDINISARPMSAALYDRGAKLLLVVSLVMGVLAIRHFSRWFLHTAQAV